MPLLPLTQGDRIARLQNRTVYSNILSSKQAVDEGKQARVNYVSGSGATQDSSIDFANTVAPTQFIQSELDTILLNSSSITAPDAPTNVTGTGALNSVNLAWNAPASNGGSVITGYTVISTPGGITATSTVESVTVTGLTPGVSYRFIVFAKNARGDSPASYPSVSIIPSSICDPPTSVTGVAGNGQVVLSWTAPVSTGFLPILDYTITSSPVVSIPSTSSTSTTITGLANGTPYTFSVRARTAAGNSSASASSPITPRTVPGAPTTVTGVAGNGQVVVSWLAPDSNGGSAVTAYRVTSSPGGFTATSSSLSATVTGLMNGTSYTFTVVATNVAGSSVASSASSSITPITVPTPPKSVTAMSGNGQVIVSWVAPAYNGGSAIIDYTVTSSPGGFTATSSSLTGTVTGLANGTSYTFTVTARNDAGSSSASPPSNPSTPMNKAAYNTKILVLGDAQVSATRNAIYNEINSRGYTNITATAQQLSTTYTGAGLTKANFDVVLLWTNTSEIGQNGWETNLNTFVAAGGSVVTASYIWSLKTPGFDLTQTPFQANASSTDASGNFTKDTAHPIIDGIAESSLGGAVQTNGAVALQSGATKISTYAASGNPFIAVKTVGSSRLVGINAYIAPASNDITKSVVVNSCLWAGNVPLA